MDGDCIMKKCRMETADITVDMQGYLLANLQEWKHFSRLDNLAGRKWVKNKWALRQELDLSQAKTERFQMPRRRSHPFFDSPEYQ